MKALIAIGKMTTHRFRGRLYQREEWTSDGDTRVLWRYKHWTGWRPVLDADARRLEQDFALVEHGAQGR